MIGEPRSLSFGTSLAARCIYEPTFASCNKAAGVVSLPIAGLFESRLLGGERDCPARGAFTLHVLQGESMPLKMRVHDREPIGAALRRFKKLLERTGIQRELRKRKYYEKPCELRRRAKLRKQSAIRRGKTETTDGRAM
jgi:small subunit ribosomal protein S21